MNRMAAAGTCWDLLGRSEDRWADLRGRAGVEDLCHGFDGTQGSGVSGEGSEPKKFYFVSFVFGKLQFRS